MLPAIATAQEIPEKELAKPTALVNPGIKDVIAGIPLADGRLLFRELNAHFYRADFASGKAETLLSAGGEENQFRMAGPPLRWTGDSIAIADIGKARLMILSPDGSFAHSVRLGGAGLMRATPQPPQAARAPGGPPTRGGGGPPGGPGGGRGSRQTAFLYAAGNTTLIGTGSPPPVPTAPPKTVVSPLPPRLPYPVIRISLSSGIMDTVTQLLPAQLPRPDDLNSVTAALRVSVSTVPLQAVDTWAAFRDGTVAIIRAGNYHVDFVMPDGTRFQNGPIPFPKIAVTDGEKKAILAEEKKAREDARARNKSNSFMTSYAFIEPEVWPATHPPFRADVGIIVDAEDRLWLTVRCAKDERAVCYDVIDKGGNRAERYRLPPKTRVLAVSKDAVFTVNEQKDDKPVLQRHPLN
ncbi:MAG: hypothetical protein ABIW79_02250 [Gemmatimonas sp.]